MFEVNLQVRSLRQLILGSFLVALVPLLALLWQSQSDIAKLRLNTEKNTRFFVNTSGIMQSLSGTALDIERLTLQHFVYPNETLKQLNDEMLSQFRRKLSPFCLELVKSDACGDLNTQIAHLGNYSKMSERVIVDAHLTRFKKSIATLRFDVERAVSERVAQQQNFMSSMQQKQAWSTAILTLLSLVLILFASQLIVKPVRKLKNIINAIANNDKVLPAKSSNGPRELIAVERDLYNLYHRIQQLEKVRMALLRHASHELKTPLASMKEGCALMTEETIGSLNSNQREVLSLINGSTDRLTILIEKLLDYNALLQQAEPSFELLDAETIINECVGDNRLILVQTERQVEINIAEQERQLVTDAELFRRILDNLVSNAIAHGRQKTPIKISLTGNNTAIFLDICNHGAPISDNERASIFEPFKRGENERNDLVMGAGLGLSIVSDCANLLDGDVTILEMEGMDVCFRVRLKRREIK